MQRKMKKTFNLFQKKKRRRSASFLIADQLAQKSLIKKLLPVKLSRFVILSYEGIINPSLTILIRFLRYFRAGIKSFVKSRSFLPFLNKRISEVNKCFSSSTRSLFIRSYQIFFISVFSRYFFRCGFTRARSDCGCFRCRSGWILDSFFNCRWKCEFLSRIFSCVLYLILHFITHRCFLFEYVILSSSFFIKDVVLKGREEIKSLIDLSFCNICAFIRHILYVI